MARLRCTEGHAKRNVLRKRRSIVSGTTIAGLDSDPNNNDEKPLVEDNMRNSLLIQSSPMLPTPTPNPVMKAIVVDPPKPEVKL